MRKSAKIFCMMIKYQNDAGIVFMDVFDFLLDKESI